MNSDLKLIKKKYGEEMSHLCRELFPILLEQEGLLSKLLLDNFEPSHFLYEDIVKNNLINDFKNFIYDQINVKKEKIKAEPTKTPQELLSEVGYDLYECHSESDIQKFKKYYAPYEDLCTFDGGRLNSCYVFFAVKKNVNQIRRSDFTEPERQDEYGTSVISIQFTRDKSHTLSIKNRYNHTVDNPDATFSNNLDNIIPGLTDSFSKYYGLRHKNKKGKNDSFEIPSYVRANDGKYYAYNIEVNNVYYCLNNIVIDNFEVCRYNKDDVLLFDNFLIKFKTKEIIKVDSSKDGFLELCSNIDKIEVLKEEKNKIIRIYDQKAGITELELNNKNTIIKLKNERVKKIGNYFLYHNKTLQEIILSNVEKIDNNFCMHAVNLNKIELPKAEYIGDAFLFFNLDLKKLVLHKVKDIESSFLSSNRELDEIILPNVEIIGYGFLEYNEKLKEISFPNAREIGDNFLENNQNLIKIDLPNVIKVGDYFLNLNNSLKKVSLSKLEYIEHGFLQFNERLQILDVPSVKYIGNRVLEKNTNLRELNMPYVQYIGKNFLNQNKILETLNMPSIEYIRKGFLSNNKRFQDKTPQDFIDNVRVNTCDQVNHRSDRTIKISVKRYK